MKVNRDKAVAVLEAIGCKSAPKWDDATLAKKLNTPGKLEELKGEDTIQDNALAALYDQMNVAVAAGETVEVGDGGGTTRRNAKMVEVPDAPVVQANGKPKAAKAAKPKTKTIDKEADNVRKNLSKPKTKAPNGKAEKKPRKNVDSDGRGPGVAAAIEEILCSASKQKPLTKKEVLAKLLRKFPDRPEGSLWNTTSSQIPNRIVKERGVKVYKVERAKDGKNAFYATAK